MMTFEQAQKDLNDLLHRLKATFRIEWEPPTEEEKQGLVINLEGRKKKYSLIYMAQPHAVVEAGSFGDDCDLLLTAFLLSVGQDTELGKLVKALQPADAEESAQLTVVRDIQDLAEWTSITYDPNLPNLLEMEIEFGNPNYYPVRLVSPGGKVSRVLKSGPFERGTEEYVVRNAADDPHGDKQAWESVFMRDYLADYDYRNRFSTDPKLELLSMSENLWGDLAAEIMQQIAGVKEVRVGATEKSFFFVSGEVETPEKYHSLFKVSWERGAYDVALFISPNSTKYTEPKSACFHRVGVHINDEFYMNSEMPPGFSAYTHHASQFKHLLRIFFADAVAAPMLEQFGVRFLP